MQKLPAHISEHLIQIIHKLGNRDYIELESGEMPILVVRDLDQQIEYCGDTYRCFELDHDVTYDNSLEQIRMHFMICMNSTSHGLSFVNKAFPYYLELYPYDDRHSQCEGFVLRKFATAYVLETTAAQEQQVDAAIMLMTLLKFRGF